VQSLKSKIENSETLNRCESEQGIDMTEWVKREHGKGEIDRAGKTLIPWWKNPRMRDETQEESRARNIAFGIVENWRTCHGLPLNAFQAALRGRAKRVEADVIVAQRLKRFGSVMNKLVREPTMKLSQMQDLGGCRAILSSVKSVNDLFHMYRGDEPLLPTEDSLKCYDYIKEPKEDGYRGIHIAARYHPRVRDREPWRDQRIEIQLRTQLQHAFATAVETVTTFTRQPLKFGTGPEEWRKFFSLMGSALADLEGTPYVKNTPTNHNSLILELQDITEELKVRQRLHGWADAVKVLPRRNMKGFKWLLLVLNTADNTVKVTGYADRTEASRVIASLEKSKRDDLDAVLVWVNSVRNLRSAYPNYYADTHGFLNALDTVLGPKK
jgi:Region found in RelA / SpoT proteins